jgi:hypothetical protein
MQNKRCDSPFPACGSRVTSASETGCADRKVEGVFISSLARPDPHPARLTLATFSRKREKGWTQGPN